jgi:hypothetical protein
VIVTGSFELIASMVPGNGEPPIEFIKPLVPGRPVGAVAAKVPFPDQPGSIARFLHDMADRNVFRQQIYTSSVSLLNAAYIARISPYTAMSRVQPGHQNATRGTAYSRACIGLGKPQAIGRQAVNMGRFEF